MVFGLHGADHVDGLHVENVGERSVLGQVQVLLHVAEGYRWQVGEASREGLCFAGEVLCRDGAIDDAELGRFGAGDDIGGEVELTRLRGADEMRQEIASAIVTRRADLREGGCELGVVGRDAHVTGQCDGEASTCGGARDHGQRWLWHFMQHAAEVGARPDAVYPLIECRCGSAFGLRGHEALHVAACAEGATGAGDHDHAHFRVEGEAGGRGRQGLDEFTRQRVARLRPVEGERRDAVFKCFDQMGGHVVLQWRLWTA